MAKKKRRVGYGVKPPNINYGQAIKFVKKIYEDAGDNVSEDQLSSIMGNSVRSSSFRLNLAALKAFGLVTHEGKGKRIGVSELGRRIVAPISSEERSQALKTAFLKIEVYRKLFETWAGKILPADEFLLNTIHDRCKVPSELTKRWKNSFIQSGRAAGLFQGRPDGKIQLRLEPNGVVQPVVEEQPVSDQGEELPRYERQLGIAAVKPRLSGDYERFQIPLLEGRIGLVELPKGWTDSDIKKMVEVMRVMFLWGEKEAKQ